MKYIRRNIVVLLVLLPILSCNISDFDEISSLYHHNNNVLERFVNIVVEKGLVTYINITKKRLPEKLLSMNFNDKKIIKLQKVDSNNVNGIAEEIKSNDFMEVSKAYFTKIGYNPTSEDLNTINEILKFMNSNDIDVIYSSNDDVNIVVGTGTLLQYRIYGTPPIDVKTSKKIYLKWYYVVK